MYLKQLDSKAMNLAIVQPGGLILVIVQCQVILEIDICIITDNLTLMNWQQKDWIQLGSHDPIDKNTGL